MLQRPPIFYDRRFFDCPPTQSLAACVAVVEDEFATLRLTDGSVTVQIDFLYSSPEECDAALKKLEQIETMMAEFSVSLREQLSKRRVIAEAIAEPPCV